MPLTNPSPNFNARRDGKTPALVVLHYTGMKTGRDALERLCDPAAEVSAHYLIDEDGRLHALVAEDQRAWHAGVGYWAGERDINSASIGIELVNPGHEWGYTPFPETQIDALTDLLAGIMTRHAIPPEGVIGHSDLAPGRKSDPGELFPWGHLAHLGLARATPAPAPPCAFEDMAELFSQLGYAHPADAARGADILTPTAPFDAVLNAFQRRFCPDQLGRRASSETRGILAALTNPATS